MNHHLIVTGPARIVFYYRNVPGQYHFYCNLTERVVTPQLVFRMNMSHDDDETCEETEKYNQTTFVMSRTLDHNSNPWEWSRCSRDHVTHFIE